MTVQVTREYRRGSPGDPNSVWNVRSATLTTVMSRIDMMAPRTTTPATLRTAASIFSGYSTAGVVAGADKRVPLSSGAWCEVVVRRGRDAAKRGNNLTGGQPRSASRY